MSEHPILFSGAMVRAIQDDRKTKTRRVIVPQPPRQLYGIDGNDFNTYVLASRDNPNEPDWSFSVRCPYGKPGDRLWVRETWQARSPRDLEWSVYKPNERKGYAPHEWTIRYAATDQSFAEWSGWNPSIFMPRWASRITLEVVSVGVERVQDISADDIEAEGIPHNPMGQLSYRNDRYQRTQDFIWLWDQINARRGYSWETNPWVWVVEFRRIV